MDALNPNNLKYLFYVVYFIIFACALANTINPKWFWKHSQGWKAKEQPSDIYFLIQRFISLVVLIIVSIMIFTLKI